MTGTTSPHDRLASEESLERLRASLVSCFKGRKKAPQVGIFWFHRKKVIGDFFDLSVADLYGHVLGPCSDHYVFWPTIQRQFPELRLVEYEFVPRGRVLFDLVRGGFVILSSTRIVSGKTAVAGIKRKFHLPSDFPIFLETDLHYENPMDATFSDEDVAPSNRQENDQ